MTLTPQKYETLPPFKAWVQQSLPSIYDDSLSYTDLLSKMLYYINGLVGNNNNLISDMKNTIEYINNYFNGLNVDEAIENKLDKMAKDGTLENIIKPYIDKYNARKYIFIGDSYAQGFSPDGITKPWDNLIIEKLSLTNSIRANYGGIGFVATNDGYNFNTLLSNIPNDSDVTDIIVGGGYNDTGKSQSEINAAINNFKTTAKQKFPNAKIYVAFIGNTNLVAKKLDLYIAKSYYSKSCYENGVNFLTNTEYALSVYNKLFATDGYHPNQLGQEHISNAIISALGKGYNFDYSYQQLPIILNSGIDVDLNTLGYERFNNHVTLSLQNSGKSLNLTTPVAINSINGCFINIGNINKDKQYDIFFLGNNYYTNVLEVQLIINTTDSGYYNATGELVFANSNLTLHIDAIINREGNNYINTSIQNVQFISNAYKVLSCDY